ncbi:hypothetical protein [Anaerobranca gottschalkii]|uniref:Uncharacterized protein n=1 Tax=Anaerobranca gottschalkii DSM 13577 TaxID=1120990 RepID=A0A1I0CNJ4_9FIRM|nr:hypothetical protein [Anaerobranca gottschalkii]SET21168.1 hypothetical protein SAMN03080614_10845 [Anaerobranca gottschalkii DSM 13577]
MGAKTTSYTVVGLGIIVSLIGWYIRGELGAGILGFGLAHIVLGLLDTARPSVK